MHISVKPLTYVTTHCYHLTLNMFSCDNLVEVFFMPKKLCLLKSENDHEMSLSQTVDQTKVL